MRSVTVHDLKAAIDAGPIVVIDVREPAEYAEGHVPGATLIPLRTVPEHVGELPTDNTVYVVCAVGGRSAQAAAFLATRGVDAVNVDGGTNDWVAAGYLVEH
jgi:rhodanese-related sulfurtransferase